MCIVRRSWPGLWLTLIVFFGQEPLAEAQTSFELLAKAQPDEFYTGLGNAYYPLGEQPPDLPGQAKVNYDYIWGMDTDGRYLWFGTAANVGALGAASFGLSIPTEFKSPVKKIPYRVFEFGLSKYPRGTSFLEAQLGDWRPPKIYRYDTQTQTLVEFTPSDPLINQILGLRSVGIVDNLVLAGGPTFNSAGICLFAFDLNTGEFLGSKLLKDYSNIRRWLRVDGGLYTAVQNFIPFPSRGSVLRWTGTRTSPFQFETVGNIDNDGAYLTAHEGRLICGTWPSPSVVASALMMSTPVVGLWVSPPLPSGGLTRRHALQWKKLWTADRYEPDPVMATTYSMGAMVPYGDYLYFGTMHYPGLAMEIYQNAYPDYQPQLKDLPNLSRAAVLLRAKNWGAKTGPTVELLYGDPIVPAFTSDGAGSGAWSFKPNAMRVPGKYGTSGFGDSSNLYVWSGTVHRGGLFFGTFAFTPEFDFVVDGLSRPSVGGDLYRFPSTSSAAAALSVNGLGNPANHGVRNVVSTPAGLYLGTANGMNLLTDPTDSLPDGGWELRRLDE